MNSPTFGADRLVCLLRLRELLNPLVHKDGTISFGTFDDHRKREALEILRDLIQREATWKGDST